MSRVLGMLLGLVVCSTAGLLAQESGRPKPSKPEPASCGTIERLHALDGILLASQPTPEDFKLLREKGVKTVINLRTKDELNWDEEAHVKGLKMEYVHVPIGGNADLTEEKFDAVRKVLTDKGKKPVVLHCASANRVGAMWLVHRVLDHDLGFAEALKEAETVGLKSPAFTARAREYVAKKQGK